MKLLTKLILFTLLLAAAASPADAQQKKKFCPAPPPSPFKHNGQIVTRFDSAAGVMRTTLEHPRVLGGGQDAIYLSASFVHMDPRRPASPTMELIFISTSAAVKYFETHDLVFLYDGKQRPFNGATRYQSRKQGDGTIIEAARVTVTYGDLLALTRSKKVAARLGPTQFELTNNHLEALREIVSLMVPSPQRWRTAE